MASKVKGIPEDLLRFFQGPGGHSLIIKGPAGTGKTTMALQLIEELGELGGSYYMSIRISDESLYNQFPWLREKLRRNDMVQVGRGFLRTVRAGEEPPKEPPEGEKVKTARKLLRSVTGGEVRVSKVDRTELNRLEGRVEMGQEGDEVYDKVGEGEVEDNSVVFDLGSDLPELDMAYEAVEANLPRKSLVIIDSIDALSERYGIHPSKLVNTLQKDLVENSNTNVVYVLENSGETRLDYLGDGVVQLRSDELAGRRIRLLVVEKLRGTEIRQHKYVFTLKDGRIRAFSSREGEVPSRGKRWQAVADPSRDLVSTGHEDLDLLVGGIPKGGVWALEVGSNVPSRYVDGLLLGLVANFAAQGRGVAFLPPRKSNAEGIREALEPLVGAEGMQEALVILEAAPVGSLEAPARVMQLEGTMENDLKWSAVEFHLAKAKHPFLSLMAFDALEAFYPSKDIIGGLTGHMAALRRKGDIFVGVGYQQGRSTGGLSTTASVHLRVENLDGTILLYGEKPYTGIFHLGFEAVDGKLKVRLTPMV